MTDPWTDADEAWDSLLYQAFAEWNEPSNHGKARKALAQRLAGLETDAVVKARGEALREAREETETCVSILSDHADCESPIEVLRRLISTRDAAARELLFLVAIEGISTLSRGGKGCVFRALEALRPDIARQWADEADPHDLLRVYFPDSDEPHHVLIIGKHTGKPIGCMNDPDADAFCYAQREDPGCTFVSVDPEECPVCSSFEEGT